MAAKDTASGNGSEDGRQRAGDPSGAEPSDPAIRRVARYYDLPSPTGPGGAEGVPGAGLVWYLGRDHLSPSLDDDDPVALDADRWREGASRRCLRLGQKLLGQGLPSRGPGHSRRPMLLDIGSGIGGPARDLEAALGCRVISLNLSLTQLASSRALARAQMPASPLATGLTRGDARSVPLAAESLDGAYAINSLYHVPDLERVTREVARCLRPGAALGIDDWLLTDQAGPDTRDRLRHEWSSPAGFHSVSAVRQSFRSAGLSAEDEVDFTSAAGRFLSEERFGRVFDHQVRPRLLEAFPKLYRYPGYEPAHAALAADQLRAAVLLMGRLYREGQAVYRQLVARKPGA